MFWTESDIVGRNNKAYRVVVANGEPNAHT